MLNAQDSFFKKAERYTNIDSSIVFVERYLDELKDSGDSARMVDGICLLSRKYTVKSLYTRAEKLAEKWLSSSFVQNRSDCRARLFLELGRIYKYEGTYSLSLAHYLKAKEIFEERADWRMVSNCEVELAEYYRKLAKYKNAIEFIRQSLNTYKKNALSDTALLIQIYNRAAAIDNESNAEPFSSVRNSRIALHLSRISGNKYAEATSMNELGFSNKNYRNNDSAEYFYKKAEEIWLSIGAEREALHAMSNRAMLYLHNEYHKNEAVRIYYDIIRIVKEKKIDFPLEDAYGYLWSTYNRAGKTDTAFKYFLLYHAHVIDNIRKKNDLAVTNITEKYENEKNKKAFARISGELSSSRSKNRKMFLFIGLLVLLLFVIVALLWRLKKTNSALNERNKEKDALIQEIHHRVKNNLQFISSLINMQMNSSIDDKEIHTLNDASRRIRAMALVHEMLYNHKESSGISIKQYLEELVLSLDQLVNSEKIPITFKMDMDDSSFNVSDSIALGMITSELVSNSMKHAFKNVDSPEIEVILRKHEKKVSFSVRDNGIGSVRENEQKKTLGLRLIDIFSRQLKGKYSIAMNSGYSYELQFAMK